MQIQNIDLENAVAVCDDLASYLTGDPFCETHPGLNTLTVLLAVALLLAEVVDASAQAEPEPNACSKDLINKFLAPLMCAAIDGQVTVTH